MELVLSLNLTASFFPSLQIAKISAPSILGHAMGEMGQIISHL